jgi:hypothetical protein
VSDVPCLLEHSVDVNVGLSFAWKYRTDIRTWQDPPARFSLDGPFADGSWGTTSIPDHPLIRWQVRDVQPGRSFVMEMPLDPAAVLSFEWRFDAVSDHRTRMTQRIVLTGDNAPAYEAAIRARFESTLADGMKRIAESMASSSPAGGTDQQLPTV